MSRVSARTGILPCLAAEEGEGGGGEGLIYTVMERSRYCLNSDELLSCDFFAILVTGM